MPFIRYTRDKRGYETTFVMHAYRTSAGGTRTRVLYFFRSPSSLKIGRRPLDEEAREALEHTHPDLSFDWGALGRESQYERQEDRGRERRGRASRPASAASASEPGPPAVIDESLLGRAVGAAEAARLRHRYGILVQRIARRARTPEERERLDERAQRLNPDEWPDEAAARAGIREREVAWEALGQELPLRRRGRRGGRRRQGEAAGPGEMPADQASGILADDGDANESGEHIEVAGARPDAPAAGDVDRRGTEPDTDRPTGADFQNDD